MADYNNTQPSTEKKTTTYATDEAGMLRDAKQFAAKDFKQTLELVRMLGIDGVANEESTSKYVVPDEAVAKALISLKLKHIKNARLNRVTYFDV